MKFSALFTPIVLASVVLAHPEPHVHVSRAELARRQLAARERHLKARNCAADIAAFNARRKAKRSALSLAKRQESSSSASVASSTSASSTSSAAAPHYTTLKSDTTCVLAPEVTEGPYYINNELMRQNLTEDQPGVPLVLDIGVMDVDSCTPLDNVFVEIWAANATGVYSGYPASSGGGGGEGGSGGPPSGAMSAGDASMTMSMPSGGGGGGMGSGGMSSTSLARNETFLRGGWPTDSAGIVELTTIYPGYYTGRTAHIHTMIHMNYTTSPNGTLSSHSGTLLHIGQFFFNESWNDQVYALSPYSENTGNTRTLNDADTILETENADGNNAYLDLELLGSTVQDGILGYITVGVSSSASYSITNTNYLNSTDASSSSNTSSATDGSSGNGDMKIFGVTGLYTSALVLVSAFFCYNIFGQ